MNYLAVFSSVMTYWTRPNLIMFPGFNGYPSTLLLPLKNFFVTVKGHIIGLNTLIYGYCSLILKFISGLSLQNCWNSALFSIFWAYLSRALLKFSSFNAVFILNCDFLLVFDAKISQTPMRSLLGLGWLAGSIIVLQSKLGVSYLLYGIPKCGHPFLFRSDFFNLWEFSFWRKRLFDFNWCIDLRLLRSQTDHVSPWTRF
jgi:hypothetical protein